MNKESEIKAVIQERGGVPPFTVWSSAFEDIMDGQPIPGSGMPAHASKAEDIDIAISQYIGFIDEPGRGTKRTQEPRIMDSRDVQVYP